MVVFTVLPKALSVVVSLRAEDTCDARLAACGPMLLVVAVCGPRMPHVERSVRVGHFAFSNQSEQLIAPNSQIPHSVGGDGGGGVRQSI
jgi:hypothetical protein